MPENGSGGAGREGREGRNTKAHEKILEDDGCAHYLDCGDGFSEWFNQIVHSKYMQLLYVHYNSSELGRQGGCGSCSVLVLC